MLRVLDLVKVSFLLLTAVFAVVRCHNNEYLNPEWVDPHDWTVKDKDPLQQLCPQVQQCKPCENTAKSEYLRLVNSLFNPNEFHFDESTNYLYRNVHIHITKEQFEKLRKSSDPVHIDGLVSEILAQTDFGTLQLVKEYTYDIAATLWEHMPTMPSFSLVRTSFPDINFSSLPRSRPIFINFVMFFIGFFVCRRFGINYFVALFFVLVYCLYEYLDNECHRRIELDEAIDFIYGEEQNPCKSRAKINWYEWLLGKDSRSKCRDFLERKSTSKTQCGVVDLFHEFFANVLMKQLKTFFLAVAEIVQSISATNGILITAVTLYFMKGLLMTLIQSVFKYVINPAIWSRVMADFNSSPTHNDRNISPEPAQRVQALCEPDQRDVNVGKALDLANTQLPIICKMMEMLQVQPSGVQVLAVKGAATPEKNPNDTMPSTSSDSLNIIQNNENTSSRSNSFEEFVENETIISQNSEQDARVVIIDDIQLNNSVSFEYSDTMPNDEKLNISSQSDGSLNTSTSNESTESNADSIEIISISSGSVNTNTL